jgi:hypothetical protein
MSETTLCANASSQFWIANQGVTLNYGDDFLQVTSRQSRSTPGVYTHITVTPGETLCLTITGYSTKRYNAFLWLDRPDTKKRIIPNYCMIPQSEPKISEAVSIAVEIPSDAPAKLRIGVLFTNTQLGDAFVLNSISIKFNYSGDCCNIVCAPTPYPCGPSHACSAPCLPDYSPACGPSSSAESTACGLPSESSSSCCPAESSSSSCCLPDSTCEDAQSLDQMYCILQSILSRLD